MSNTEISRIETGERKEPSPLILKAIAQHLDISYLDLYLKCGYIDKELIDILKESQHIINTIKNSDLEHKINELLKNI